MSSDEQVPTRKRGAMARLWQYGLPLLPFLTLVAVLSLGLGRDPSLVPSPFVGDDLPSFTGARLDNDDRLDPSANLRGQVWMLNVWASWCVPCLHEHPQITWLAKSGLPVVGLNYKDDKKNALAWLDTNGDPFIYSLADNDGSIGIELGVYGVPESYLVDTEGMVVLKHVGPLFKTNAEEILAAAQEAGLEAGT